MENNHSTLRKKCTFENDLKMDHIPLFGCETLNTCRKLRSLTMSSMKKFNTVPMYVSPDGYSKTAYNDVQKKSINWNLQRLMSH